MWKRVFITTLALGALVGCSSGGSDRVTAESVYEKCNQSDLLTLTSDKKGIKFSFRPGSETPESVYYCLLKETSAPSTVDYKVGETRPIDGAQSTEWDGWELNWSYDGKYKGSQMLLTEN